MDKRALAIVDVRPVFHISFSRSLSWANPFIFGVLASPRLKCDGISESREPRDKSRLFYSPDGKGLRRFPLFCLLPYLSFIFFNQAGLEQSRSGRHANVTGENRGIQGS